MKTSLTPLALALAAAFPAAFIMELAGLPLPAIVGSAHLFDTFMLTVFAQIMLIDYSIPLQTAPSNPTATDALPSVAAAKSPLRLAA